MRLRMLIGLGATIVTVASLGPAVAAAPSDDARPISGLVDTVLPEPLPELLPIRELAPELPVLPPPPPVPAPVPPAPDSGVPVPAAPDPPVVPGDTAAAEDSPALAPSTGTQPTWEPGGTVSTGGPREAPRPAAGSPADRRAQAPAQQRRLRRAVVEARACLAQLGVRERRVLALRAGLGPRPALSRIEVARRLSVGVAQAARIERRGLRHLGSLDAAGGCGATSGGGLLATSSSDGTPFAGASDGANRGVAPTFGVAGVSDSGGPAPSDDGPGLPPFGQGGDSTLLVSLGLFVTLLLLVRRELSRR